MFGVVLWSDPQEHKAVIWCEDHGDLAFYRQPQNGDQICLDAGDWVQFDMTTTRNMRLAENPRLVAEGLFAELAETLAASGLPKPTAMPRHDRRSADIVPFVRPACAGRAAPELAAQQA